MLLGLDYGVAAERMHIPKRENAPLKPSANENAPKKKLINQVRIGRAKVKAPT